MAAGVLATIPPALKPFFTVFSQDAPHRQREHPAMTLANKLAEERGARWPRLVRRRVSLIALHGERNPTYGLAMRMRCSGTL